MRSSTGVLTLALASVVLLAGCSTATTEPYAMSDMAMEPGIEHSEMTHSTPSEAAQMVCSADIQDSIAAVLGLPSVPDPADDFADGLYTCAYDVAEGSLVLSVMESVDPDAAAAHAETVKSSFDSVADIEGLANLGLPAYETADGVVVFVKDNMTLQVDAREAPSDLQPEVSRTHIAYQVATNVLACWKAHP